MVRDIYGNIIALVETIQQKPKCLWKLSNISFKLSIDLPVFFFSGGGEHICRCSNLFID